MTKVAEILDFLDECAPIASKMDFDNVGLLVGRSNADVTKVIVALDILPETILEAETLGAQLIVSHHPVIFRPAASVTDLDTTGQRVLMLAERRIAAICMHTNLDAAVGGVNDALAARLKLNDVQMLPNSDNICRFGRISPIKLREFAEFVRDSLGTNGVRFCDAGRSVERVAVGGGACGDYIAAAVAAGCDTMVVGEAKHHEHLEGKMLGLNLIEVGHFASENVVCDELVRRISERFGDVEVVLSKTQREVTEYC